MRVAVTGAGGLIGRRLVDRLVADPDVSEVVALDLRPAAVPVGATARPVDVRDPGIRAALTDVDALVHLAFQVDPWQDEAAMRRVNVDGTRTTLEAAVAAGVGRLVVASSATVYGAHPGNDLPLTESSPLRPETTFSYARHKGEVEDLVWGMAAALPPETTVTVLRPAIVAGPGVRNFITDQLELPRLLRVAGHEPPLQLVHVDDVAAAFHHVATRDLPGAFNVTAEGWLSQDEVLGIIGRRPLVLPEEVAWTVADLLWRSGVGTAPAGMLSYVMHPWVMDGGRIAATGWRPRYSNRDALAQMAAEHADWLAVGRLRVRRSALRAALVAAVGVTAAVRLLGRDG